MLEEIVGSSGPRADKTIRHLIKNWGDSSVVKKLYNKKEKSTLLSLLVF
jgi:hypothetical protein